MQLQTIDDVKHDALTKWREYNDACKKDPKNKLYEDAKKMYFQLRNGKTLIDVNEVMPAGGNHPNGHPKLAIAQAHMKRIRLEYDCSGPALFRDPTNKGWRSTDYRTDVRVNLQPFNRKLTGVLYYENKDINRPVYGSSFYLQAPVPIIPPKCLPKVLTADHYILWEVDKWEMLPPTDPYLLRRITKTIFSVEAQWDLTPVEKAAMAGRMH